MRVILVIIISTILIVSGYYFLNNNKPVTQNSLKPQTFLDNSSINKEVPKTNNWKTVYGTYNENKIFEIKVPLEWKEINSTFDSKNILILQAPDNSTIKIEIQLAGNTSLEERVAEADKTRNAVSRGEVSMDNYLSIQRIEKNKYDPINNPNSIVRYLIAGKYFITFSNIASSKDQAVDYYIDILSTFKFIGQDW